MIDTTRICLVSLLTMLAIIRAACPAHALPPLGLTQISPSSTLQPNLELIDGTAYLGVFIGVWSVDSLGTTYFVPISHPTLGTPDSVTRVVKTLDGELYVAASYGNFNNPRGAALYDLEQPTAPHISWLGNNLVNGVDRERTVYGNVVQPSIGFEASLFHLDGSIETLPYPPGSDSSNNNTQLDTATLNGYAFGGAGIPGTIAASPVIWTPDRDISFIFGSGVVTSGRDRSDGQGVNIGAFDVLLGQDYYPIEDMNGDYLFVDDNGIIVSHGDFVVVQAYPSIVNVNLYGFFPGIVLNHPNRALPLLDIFPELATVDIDRITDLASVDGYLYMTLSGSDGTFLFGARDPSAIPEPTTAILLLTALPWLTRRKSTIIFYPGTKHGFSRIEIPRTIPYLIRANPWPKSIPHFCPILCFLWLIIYGSFRKPAG